MMRIVSLALLVLALSATVRADEPVINEAMREFADTLEKATTHLATIRDAESAKKAVEALVPLNKQFADQFTRWEKAGKNEEPGGAINQRFQKNLETFIIEWRRVTALPGASVSLEKLPSFSALVAKYEAAEKTSATNTCQESRTRS
jgi:hypothetical protein